MATRLAPVRDEYLFTGPQLSDVLRGRQANMEARAAALPPERALGVSPAELAAELVADFQVEPLTLLVHKVEAAQDEAQIERGYGSSGQRVSHPGTKITYFVPFTGEAELFNFQPSTFTSVWPNGVIRDGHLEVSHQSVDASADVVKRALNDAIGLVNRWVGFVNPQVEAFNASLPGWAQGAVDMRIAKLRADNDLVASLGVPMRRRPDAPQTYVAPAIRRKPDIRASGPSRSPAARLEPVMDAKEYEHILSVIRNMVAVMERSPSAFAQMREEDLRQHFLVQLNAQYEATAETFNFEGKTDILVRIDARIVFIAECKFWGGPKVMTRTIDQLLGYTSWRDTKTAILLFNRGRGLSTVLEKIVPTVAAHPNFVRQVPYGDETSFRFVLSHRDDPERHLTLTVMVFDLPA